MNSENLEEKQKKAGNPIFIVIIFVCLIGFLVFIPDIYKKYNTEISEFLGINKKEEQQDKPEDNKAATSAFYQIGSGGTLKFNEITLKDISLSADKKTLAFKIETEDIADLDELEYYLEFYQNRTKFLGRRALHSRVTRVMPFEIDISNLNVDTTTYFTVSHIDKNTIPKEDIDTDESGLASLTCIKDNYTYQYEFYLNKLSKVTKKYSYTNQDQNAYAEELLKVKKMEKEYNNYNGINASVVENAGTLLFIADFDYADVKTFARLNDLNIFEKGTSNTIVNFKMDAEGYECS